MTTHRWLTPLFLLAATLPPLVAAEPLTIPAGALVAVQVTGRDQAISGVEQFVAAVKPGAKLDLENRLRQVFTDAGRDVSVVPGGRPVIALAFTFDGWNSPAPPWVWVLPVDDAKAFREAFLTEAERGDYEAGKERIGRAGPWFLVEKPGTIALTASEDSARAYRDSKQALTPEHLGKLAPLISDSDASVYVNVAAINAKYGDTIRSSVQFAEFLLQSGGNGLIPAFDPKQLEVVKYALGGVKQFLADGRDLAVGLNLGKDGAKLRVEANFTPGSPTAKRFAGDSPVSLDAVSMLPAGYPFASASEWGPAAAAVWQTVTREYRAPKDDRRAVAAVETLEELQRQGGVKVSVGGSAGGGFVVKSPAAAKLTDAHAKVIRTLPDGGWARNLPLAEHPGIQDDALEANGFALKRATLTLDLEAGVESIRDANLREATLESIRRLVNEKTVLWFGDDGKWYAEIDAATPELACKVFGDLLGEANRAGDVPAFAATRKLLPKEASFVALAEAAPAVAMLADYTKSVSGALPAVPGFEIPEFRTVKNPPLSFLGVAATVDGSGFGLTLVVPAAAAKIAVDATVIPGQ